MDTLGSRNVEWKFGKRPIYSCRAHIATSFVPAATVTGRADCRGDLEFQGARGIRSMVCESQVSGLIILHRNRFPIFGQGRYGGAYRGFEGNFWVGCGHSCGRKRHDDVVRPRESLGGVALPVFPRRIGNDGNIRGREE
jgi:hypothetical protein